MKVLFLLWRVGIVGWVATISGSSAAVTVEQEVHLPRDTEPYVALAEQLVHDYPLLDPQDAVDIAVLLDAARKNSDTMLLVERFKEVKENDLSDEEVAPTQADMVQKLAGVFEEMKQLEKQFRDPAQAVEDLYAEGKFSVDKLSLYQDDPSLLQKQMRKSLYMGLIIAGATGDYL